MVLTAIDADVIKTYVELGFGIGIVARMAFDPARDENLRAIDASHLFEPSTTRIGLRAIIICAAMSTTSSKCSRRT